MPLISYVPKKFNPEHAAVIEQANGIINQLAREGYDLTLRQLYYQFVARDLFPESWQDPATGSTNNFRSYKKLGGIISDARRAGLIDWNRIMDRTRNVNFHSAWSSPADIVATCARSFDIDWWANQDYRPEVWVEKDALIGVLQVACQPWHCPYFSCRGYTSDSEVWQAAQRLDRADREGKTPIIFHLGDHDPSGIDMTRDVFDRINMFKRTPAEIEVRRLALNMDQVREYNPPPNPAKETDSRFADYLATHGDESWELDALNPATISNLIGDAMRGIVDQAAWDEAEAERDEGRRLLGAVSDRWVRLTEGL